MSIYIHAFLAYLANILTGLFALHALITSTLQTITVNLVHPPVKPALATINVPIVFLPMLLIMVLASAVSLANTLSQQLYPAVLAVQTVNFVLTILGAAFAKLHMVLISLPLPVLYAHHQ